MFLAHRLLFLLTFFRVRIVISIKIFQQYQHIDLNMGTLISSGGMALSNLFLYCFSGKLASESYERMAECVYECNWPDLPIKQQKYFILMISNTQKPLYYHGFGMIILNLETFSKVKKQFD